MKTTFGGDPAAATGPAATARATRAATSRAGVRIVGTAVTRRVGARPFVTRAGERSKRQVAARTVGLHPPGSLRSTGALIQRPPGYEPSPAGRGWKWPRFQPVRAL